MGKVYRWYIKMEVQKILNHLDKMKQALKDGNKAEYLVLLDILVSKTNQQQQLIVLKDFDIKISNINGLSINIINSTGDYVKYISRSHILTNNGVQPLESSLQEVIDKTFFGDMAAFFMEVERNERLDENTNKSK